MISLAYHKHEEIFGGIIKACKNKLKTKQNKTTTKKKDKKQSKNKVQSTNQQWNPVKKITKMTKNTMQNNTKIYIIKYQYTKIKQQQQHQDKQYNFRSLT